MKTTGRIFCAHSVILCLGLLAACSNSLPEFYDSESEILDILYGDGYTEEATTTGEMNLDDLDSNHQTYFSSTTEGINTPTESSTKLTLSTDSSQSIDSTQSIASTQSTDSTPSIKQEKKYDTVFFKTSTHISPKAATIHLPSLDSATHLHCTNDGTIPTIDSPIFQEDFSIEENSIIRCIGFQDSTPVTPTATHTFLIENAVKMPIVSITVDPVFLNEYYIDNKSTCKKPCKTAPYWEDIEFPVHVEYFSNGSQSTEKDFEIDAGISFAGNYSRSEEKKPVKITMRKEYQEGKLIYPLFDTRPQVNKFKSFLLRNNGTRFLRDFYGDAAATRILEGTGIDYQRSKLVVVFYNGIYYGIHDLREKINKHFIETNYGIDDDIVTVVKHYGSDITANDESPDYYDMAQFISTHNFDENNPDNYAKIESQIDMNNFADYMAYEIYAQNDDWPQNNVRAWKAPNTLWKFIAFDIDYGFDNEKFIYGFDETETMFEWIRKTNSAMRFNEFFIAFIKNPKFKQKFLNRSAILFNLFFNSTNVEKAVDQIVSQLDPAEMDRDLNRFRRHHAFFRDGETMKTWAKQRDIDIWEEYRKEFELPENITLTFKSKGHGKILIEDRSVPENYTGKFFGGVDMVLTAEPDAGFIFDSWEDGSRENPRIISPTDNAVYTATFR